MNKHILALHTFAACVNEFDLALNVDLLCVATAIDQQDFTLLDEWTEDAIKHTEQLIVTYLS